MDQKQKYLLTSETILKYLFEKDAIVENLIFSKPENVTLFIYDQNLYEALACIEDRTKINYNRLIKLLEVVNIMSYADTKERTILTPEKAKEIFSGSEEKKWKQ